MNRPMRVVITGSRSWTNRAAIERRLADLPPDTIVIHGGAEGADKEAGLAALQLGLHVAIVPALWELYGRSAGPRRNRAMLDLEPDRVIAFSHGTKGTQDCINEAEARGIPVEVIKRIPEAVS